MFPWDNNIVDSVKQVVSDFYQVDEIAEAKRVL